MGSVLTLPISATVTGPSNLLSNIFSISSVVAVEAGIHLQVGQLALGGLPIYPSGHSSSVTVLPQLPSEFLQLPSGHFP